MAYETEFVRNGYDREHTGTKLALVAGLLAVIVALALTGARAPSVEQTEIVAPVAEDWHGNVRRSHWENQGR